MNVSAMTPEPIMSVFSAGTVNHHIEVEIAIRVLQCMPKTGLPLNMQRSAAENVHAVLLRAMFRPYEHIFNKMHTLGNDNALNEARAASSFYRDAEEAQST